MAEGPSLLSAVVIGGTGNIGNCLVGALLKSKVDYCCTYRYATIDVSTMAPIAV